MRRSDRRQPRAGRWDRVAVRVGLVCLAILVVAGGSALTMVILAGRLLGVSRDERPRALPAPLALSPARQRPQAPPPLRLGGGAGTLLVAVTVLLLVLLLAGATEALVVDRRPPDFNQPLPTRPQPGLERLTGYRWIDAEAGLVQVPITRAMELLAERGLPARPRSTGGPVFETGWPAPSDSSGGRPP